MPHTRIVAPNHRHFDRSALARGVEKSITAKEDFSTALVLLAPLEMTAFGINYSGETPNNP